MNAADAVAVGPAEKIAIIGMAFQLPGQADTPDALWEMLCEQRSGITEIPSDRFSTDKFYDPNPDALGKSYTKWAGVLPQVDQFDPKFFGLSPREAAGMDPQQRLVLQSVYGAVEDAQMRLDQISALRTGVFVGVSQSDYKTVREYNEAEDEKYAGTGYAMSIVANRVSHRLNLRGPSFSVDTACSSSLVALDAGVRNLQAGTCDLAFVGGVNVIAHPAAFIAFSKAGMLSPTGELSSFDSAANGYVRGEGVGVILLKPYAKALRDGDHIHAVIEATSVNQDGQTGTMTAPSQEAQIDVIDRLFAVSGRRPEDVGFAEAHGTGTPVGDPIEAGSIGQAIGRRIPDRKLYLGSIKPNIGHLESAAGIAGVIKAVLAVQRGEIPPNHRFKEANPAIPLDALNLEVPTQTVPFPQVNGQRRAIVNSFGFGGTNASVLVASPPSAPKKVAEQAEPEAAQSAPILVPLTAASPAALSGAAAALLEARQIGALAQTSIKDVAAALAARPAMFGHRAVVICETPDDLISGLEALAADAPPEEMPAHVRIGQVKRPPKVVFTYSGQGNQSWNMARDLLAHEPVFRDALAKFDAAYAKAAGWSILAEMAKDEADSHIHETWVTQPALAAVQYGLSALWRHWGVAPDMVMGHSVGEVTAGIDSGGMSLMSAVSYLSKRSVIREQISRAGAMAAVGLPADDVAAMLPDSGLIDIAGRNGPGATTISGERAAVLAFVEEFQASYPDAFIRLLEIDGAWHSHQLDEAEDWLRDAVGAIEWQPPHTHFLSTVTAKLESRLDLDYCWQNLRQTVRYMDAVEAAIELGGTVFVEIGPHTTLKPLTLSTALQTGANVDAVASMSHKHADLPHFAAAAAELFVLGVDLDWENIVGPADGAVPLPGYTWDTDRYWSGSEEADRALFEAPSHPLLGMQATGPAPRWTNEFDLHSPAFLSDHIYAGEVLFPAAGYVDVMLGAGEALFPGQVIELENCAFHAALFLASDSSVQMQTVYAPDRGRIEVSSRTRNSGEDWILRAEAFLRPVDVVSPGTLAPLEDAPGGIHRPDTVAFYDMLAASGGVAYGPAFRTIREMKSAGPVAEARVALDADFEAGAAQHMAHPALLDGAMQTLVEDLWARVEMGSHDTPVLLPTGIAQVRSYGRLPANLRVRVLADPDETIAEGRGRIEIAGEDGEILLSVVGLQAKRMPKDAAVDPDAELPPDYIVEEFEAVELDLSVDDAALGRWVVLGPDASETAALMDALIQKGARPERLGPDTLGADITDTLADLLMAAADENAPDEPIAGVAFAATLGGAALTADSDADQVYEAVRAPVQMLIEMGVALHDVRGLTHMPRVVVLTSQARQVAGDTQTTAGVAHAPLLATMRTMSSELPELFFRHIDLSATEMDFGQCADVMLCDTPETEIVLRNETMLAARLKLRARSDLPLRRVEAGPKDETNFTVTMPQPGVIDRLDLFECDTAPVGPDEVRVRMRAVGLNFRDIMAVTGLLPEEAEAEPAWQNLGLEFGADVVAVGADVQGFKVGDRVMGMGRNCLQRFLTIQADGLIPMHDGLSYDAAATIPSAFATAHYALNTVGRLEQGDKILIHVATGGVGLAAIQIAQAKGAEIFATAGSAAKRAVLRDLGVAHVMNSRSLDYADEIAQITGGKGVDVILNSLPGSHIDKGLGILAPYGRFLEIGKRDVYADRSVGMKALRSNVSFHVIDLAAMGAERPDLMARQMRDVMQGLRAGALAPLPTNTFPVSDVRGAFRFMSQAQHVGKVVVTFDEDRFEIREDRAKPVIFRANASYLITGGTRGFTLALADWMSRQGAGCLLLASRSGQVGEEDRTTVEAMQARGTEVREIALDVTDADAVMACVQAAANDRQTPLAGILHGAAVIKDTLLTMITPEVLEDVLRPKVLGGWALHQAERSLPQPLDFMVGFSSVAQAIGSLGQSNYVAANSFLDALADYRAQQGLQGGTLDWGVIADAGFVARDEQLASYLETAGMAGLHMAETEEALATLLRTDAPRFCFARGEWQQVGRANAALGRAPRFQSLVAGGAKDDSELAKRLAGLTGEALESEIAAFVTSALSDLLKVELSATDIDMPMSDAGLDSLSSFELKMRLEAELGITIMVSHFLKAPTIAELSKVLAQTFEAERVRQAAAETAGPSGEGNTGVSQVQTRQFTDAQVGWVAAHAARFTSAAAAIALENRAILEVQEDVTDSDIQQAIFALYEDHPLLGLTCDLPQGAPPDLSMGEAPRLSKRHLAADEPLDLRSGALARIARTGAQVQVVVHRALADRASLHLLMDALKSRLAGDEGAAPPDALAALSERAHLPDTPKGMRDMAFWDHCLRGIPGPVPFARRARTLVPEHMGFDHGKAAVVEGRLSGNASEAQVLEAYATALRHADDPCGDVLIAYETSGLQGVFGPFTATLPLIVPTISSDDAAFADLERRLTAAPDHLAFDSFCAADDFAGRLQGAGARLHQIGFSWCADGLTEATLQTYQDVRLDVTAQADALIYRLIFDADVVTPQERAAIVAAFEAGVEARDQGVLAAADTTAAQ
ncbi:MAG: SDR family NAD(P)-dependent oxidoreductase [Sulfitobacter sp.]